MPKYVFQIQAMIEVTAEAENRDDARQDVCIKLENGDYDEELSNDAYLSDGRPDDS